MILSYFMIMLCFSYNASFTPVLILAGIKWYTLLLKTKFKWYRCLCLCSFFIIFQKLFFLLAFNIWVISARICCSCEQGDEWAFCQIGELSRSLAPWAALASGIWEGHFPETWLHLAGCSHLCWQRNTSWHQHSQLCVQKHRHCLLLTCYDDSVTGFFLSLCLCA